MPPFLLFPTWLCLVGLSPRHYAQPSSTLLATSSTSTVGGACLLYFVSLSFLPHVTAYELCWAVLWNSAEEFSFFCDPPLVICNILKPRRVHSVSAKSVNKSSMRDSNTQPPYLPSVPRHNDCGTDGSLRSKYGGLTGKDTWKHGHDTARPSCSSQPVSGSTYWRIYFYTVFRCTARRQGKSKFFPFPWILPFIYVLCLHPLFF